MSRTKKVLLVGGVADNAVHETTLDPGCGDALFNGAVRCRGRDQEVEAARGGTITQARNEFGKKRVREMTSGRWEDVADHVGTVASRLARRAAGCVPHFSGCAENTRARRCRHIVVPVERARDRRDGELQSLGDIPQLYRHDHP